MKSSHRPDGKIADVLALFLACTTANDASVNYRGSVPQRHRKFPSPLWKNADALASILACKTAADALVNFRLCVPQRLKHFSHIAPMGFSHVLRLCLQGGGVYIWSGTVTFLSCTITGNSAGYVRADAQNFPSPRWDFHMFCACTCRAAVFSSTAVFTSPR